MFLWVKPGSAFTFIRHLPYIASIQFTHVNLWVCHCVHVKIMRQWKSTLRGRIDLFSLYDLFSHFRPEKCFFEMSSYPHAYTKRQLKTSHDLNKENKTYILIRSVGNTEKKKRTVMLCNSPSKTTSYYLLRTDKNGSCRDQQKDLCRQHVLSQHRWWTWEPALKTCVLCLAEGTPHNLS